MSTRLDAAANAVTVLAGLAVCAALAHNAFFSKPDQEEQLKAMGVVYVNGTVLPSPEALSYEEQTYTVLVGLNSRCRYCAESMPELQRLNRIASESTAAVRIIAVAAEPMATVAEYLKANDLSSFAALPIEKGSPLAAVVGRTPSVVLVNRKGEVLASWPGLVTESRMNELLEQLRQPGRP